jgi:cytochrome c oxidase cbb3-type subunit 2
VRVTFRIVLVYGLAIFAAVVAMVVFMPAMMESTPTTIAHPYSDLEAAGRRVYYTNGCYNCHTQYVRAQDTGMGPQSVRGNYVYDIPLLFGSERTGPDLTYVGRKRGEAWLIGHLKDPRGYSPLSIMPSFEFLSEDDLRALSAYLFALGDNVAQERMILPPAPYENATDPHPVPEVPLAQAGEPHGWSTWDAAGLQGGKDLYASRCMSCHGPAGNGLGTYAGTMSVTPADFTQEPFRSMPSEQWFWHVSEGIPGTLMPTWTATLSDEEIWSVIRYVRSVFSNAIVRDPDEGSPPKEYAGKTNPVEQTYAALEDAKAIYTRECMVCHGVAGRGKGPYAGRIEPPPPDFGDGSYGVLGSPALSDADYYWRISEGLPWTAMPPWKLLHGSDDIWKLVHYIETFFTQTSVMPSGDIPSINFPDTYQSQSLPADASYERGRRSFATNCAPCHGFAGDGKGWLGSYLVPRPADFRWMSVLKIDQGNEAQYLAKITFGIPGTTMPTWGEFLPEKERWDLVHYLLQSFIAGRPTPKSVYGKDAVSAEFAMVSAEEWAETGHLISGSNGKKLYETYCATCHGQSGAGGGPGASGGASGGPAAFPAGMTSGYILWRTSQGASGTMMYAFAPILSEADMWDVASYAQELAATSAERGKGGR